MMQTTKQTVEDMRRCRPKRFCFSGDDNAKKRRPKDLEGCKHGVVQLPFWPRIRELFPYPLYTDPLYTDPLYTDPLYTDTIRTGQPDAVWRRFESPEEFKTATDWCDDCGPTVFLYDCLEMSMALGLNYDFEKKCKTELSTLEECAKHNQDRDAIDSLCKKLTTQIKQFPPLLSADFICGVPGTRAKPFHLPNQLAQKVAKNLGKADVTPYLMFGDRKPSIKDTELSNKWDILKDAGIEIDAKMPLLRDKTVLLIDDKYQSGTTLQFVASKLQPCGVTKIFGLCVVKTMRDDDNDQNK